MCIVKWWPRTSRATIKRLQSRGREHHISLLVHHEPHPSHLRVGVPSLHTQAELVGPVSLPWPPLSVPNCPSSHLTYLWDLAPLCWISAPSGPPKAKIYSLLCSAKLPVGHFPIPLWGHGVTTSPGTWDGLTTTFPLPPVFPLPFLGGRGEKPSPHQAQRSLHPGRRDGTPESLLDWPDLGVCLGLLQGAERQLCAFFLFLGDHTFFCAP